MSSLLMSHHVTFMLSRPTITSSQVWLSDSHADAYDQLYHLQSYTCCPDPDVCVCVCVCESCTKLWLL